MLLFALFYLLHNPKECIPERFYSVWLHENDNLHKIKNSCENSWGEAGHIKFLEEETYAACFTAHPFHFNSIIFNNHIKPMHT